MNVEIITKRDLEILKADLINEIRSIRFSKNKHTVERKEWLKSYEVQKMLSISAGTLQSLRQKGTIPFSKVGGLIFYKMQDVERMLTSEQCE